MALMAAYEEAGPVVLVGPVVEETVRPCLNALCRHGYVRKAISGRLTVCSACDGFGFMLVQPKAGAARYYDTLTSIGRVQSKAMQDEGAEIVDIVDAVLCRRVGED